MNWQEIREQYPHRWLVVEAYGAYTEGAQRIANHLEVVGEFGDDSKAAWKHYLELHHLDKMREYYVLHTDRIELNIGVMDAFRRVITE
jgi:hypothetical protein